MQMDIWMDAMNVICDEIERFSNVSLNSTEQHVDSRDSRINTDNADIKKLIEWFTLHYPFPTNNQIVSISTGVMGDEKINCHNAKEIGLQSMEKIIGENLII